MFRFQGKILGTILVASLIFRRTLRMAPSYLGTSLVVSQHAGTLDGIIAEVIECFSILQALKFFIIVPSIFIFSRRMFYQ